MEKSAEVKKLLEQAAIHIDTGKDLLLLITEVVNKVIKDVPPEEVAKLISATGGYLGTALKPFADKFNEMTEKWFEKQIDFVIEAQNKGLSEEAAINLIAIRAGQIRETIRNVKDNANSNKSSK